MSRVLPAVVCLFLALPFVCRADEKDNPNKPKGAPAATLLDEGLAQAKKDGKAVFLAFGSPTCGWCRYLEKYHARPAVEKTLSRHLVFVKVDIVENEGGKELYKKYTPQPGGVPVWVILGADGKVLADSFEDGKKNVGFPYEPDERTHYEKALRAALPRLTNEEVAKLRQELKEAGPPRK